MKKFKKEPKFEKINLGLGLLKYTFAPFFFFSHFDGTSPSQRSFCVFINYGLSYG